MRDPPDRETLLALHGRLFGGDRLVPGELVQLVLPSLAVEMTGKFPRIDPHTVYDGVVDAILEYCTTPRQFDPSRGVPLDRFLATAAWRNVANLARSERRRKGREVVVGREKPESDVALDPVAGNIQREEREAIDVQKAAMHAALETPADREILSLYLRGERSTTAFAGVLGVTHLTLEQQRAEVKRHKDRITRYLRRKGLLP